MHTGNKLSWFRRHPFASAALIFTAIAFGPLSMDAQADSGSGNGGGAHGHWHHQRRGGDPSR